ncbi:MAG TPA: Ig-like domain-containing protein [Terriglobales bacterium]|nr:Ig-like domain-containing protein [Terriglobales bacterium]
MACGSSGQNQSTPPSSALASLQLSPSNVSLDEGETAQFKAVATYEDNHQQDVTASVTWTATPLEIAAVDDAGLVTSAGEGTATVSASMEGASASSVVIVQRRSSGPPIPAKLFSMSFHGRVNWPTVTINGVRLWDTGTSWSSINTADQVYDWHVLDNWLSAAQANKVDLIYTFGNTPTWASSDPSLVCQEGSDVPLGSCVAPNDLNSDGTGSNQHWKDYVTAIVTHANGQIKYWEIWNEPTISKFWQGNNAQLVRMAKDAYNIIKSIDPTAQVTTPSPSTGVNGVAKWMGPYLATGGGAYADIIAFHGYSWSTKPGVWPVPEDIVALVENLKAQLLIYGQNKKPLWCTEGSWADTTQNGFTDPDLHAAYLTRHYLLQQSENVARYYWYAWDNGEWGGLWDDTTGINAAGTAYQQVENWMVGATPSGVCLANGTIWTCNFTRSGGYQAKAIWDTSKTCSHGVCTTTNVTADSRYVKYLDIAGGSHTIKNGTVPVGAKPILLVNQ